MVEMPHHLVQIISEARKLRMNEPRHVVRGLGFARGDAALAKQHGAPEMHRPHTECMSAFADGLQFTHGEVQVELSRAWLGDTWAGHCLFFLAERMRPGDWGPYSSGPQRGFAYAKHISLPSPANIKLDLPHLHRNG